MGEVITITLFAALAVATVFLAYNSSQSRWGRVRGLLPGRRAVPVEDLLLELQNLASSLATDGVTIEVEWNRFLKSDARSNQLSPLLTGLHDDGGALDQEGYHLVIVARSAHIPPFLKLPGGWTARLLEGLPEARRSAITLAVEHYALKVDGGSVRVLRELPPTSGGRVSPDEAESVKAELEKMLRAIGEVAVDLTALDQAAPGWLGAEAMRRVGTSEGLERLTLLTQHYQLHAATAEACATALEQGTDAERLLAALQPGLRGQLRTSFEQAVPSAIPEELYLTALRQICSTTNEEQDEPLLRRGLAHPAPKVRERALLELRRMGRPLPAAELLALTLWQGSEGERMVVRELGESTDPGATAALLELMERALKDAAPRFDDCERAVMALQRVGTTDAVPLLRALAEDDDDVFVELGIGRLNPPRALRREARAAVETIQARVGPHQRGTLALAEASQGGALAVADEGGALALSADDGGGEDGR